MPRLFMSEAPDGVAVSYLAPTTGIANGLPVLSWDEAAVQLGRANASWSAALGAPATVTYGFRASVSLEYAQTYLTGVGSFAQFSAMQIAVAELALQLWADVANITFVRVGEGDSGPAAYSNNATLLFGNFANGPNQFSAFAYLPDPTAMDPSAVEGDLWFNAQRPAVMDPASPLYGGGRLLSHEIGHAIGLLHPAAYGGGANSGLTYAANAQHWQDTAMFTNMSYFGESNTGASFGLAAITPMLHDIAAIQRLYGANLTTRTGDTVYGFNANADRDVFHLSNDGQSATFAIWDAGGLDTLDLSGYSTASEIDLREEAFSSAGTGAGGAAARYNISIARGAVIENAIGGAGNDTIIGNAYANNLRGNAGADAINGGDGADYLDGGAGNDVMNGEGGDDTIVWDASDTMANVNGGAGHDTLLFTVATAPTSFDLVARGFEGAEGRFVVTGATFAHFYDSQWRLSHEIGEATSGASWYIDWDETGGAPYQRLNQDFDVNGILAREYGLADSGSTWNQYFDADGSQPYVSLLQVHTAGGIYANEHGVSDNSSTWDTYFDVDGSNPFVWVQQVRDSSGVLAQEEGLADTGTRWFTDWDETGTADFEFYQNVYDTEGRLSQQEGRYDNGHTWIIDFDETHAFAWASIRRDYDENGVLISTIETPDGP